MPYSKKWLDSNPEQFRLARNGRVHRYRTTAKGKFHASQFTARKRGIEFTLTMDEFAALIVADACHWCGGTLPRTRAGLDRMDNTLGYVDGNCVPCCWKCNVMKGTMTGPEFIAMCERIAARSKSAEVSNV